MSGGAKIFWYDEDGLRIIDLSKVKVVTPMEALRVCADDDEILTVHAGTIPPRTVADIFAAGMQASVNPPRSVSSARRTASSGGSADRSRDRKDTQAIRSWAKTEGMEMSDRGRIPTEIEDAFYKAHPGIPQSGFTG